MLSSAARSLCAAALKQHSLQRQWGARRLLSQTSPRLAGQAAAPAKVAGGKGRSADSIIEDGETNDKDSLQFLQHPLGVTERPTTVSRTWAQDMLDDEVRAQRREKL